jgi:hypothetical protein
VRKERIIPSAALIPQRSVDKALQAFDDWYFGKKEARSARAYLFENKILKRL